MMAYEEEEQPKRLTDEQKVSFQKIANHLNKLAGKLGEPIDPKVDALLQMAADCIEEQIQMEKYYPRGCSHCTDDEDEHKHESGVATAREPNSSPYLFLDNDDDEDEDRNNNDESQPKLMIPSADQLKSWLSNGAPKEDDNDDTQPA